MSDPAKKLCPRCGAQLSQDPARCWLCGLEFGTRQAVGATNDSSLLPADQVEIVPEASGTYSLTTLFLVTTLIAVCFGLFAIAPGLGILMAIAAVPALVRTTIVASRRQQLGRETSTGDKIALFIGSAFTSAVMAVVVIVAGIGSFCAVCLTAQTEAAIPFAAIVGIGATLATGGLMVYWIRARFKRDIADH